ncbi:hypothetical protein [Rudanella lutea]|uniref:hypothetical protein n=1 Tax=Rudanella lutea TaxID=451374 RepID=UPI00036C9B00|nr:hypothetical protein [Rudanella lutea]
MNLQLQTFALADLLHFENHQENKQQSVYYEGVTEAFGDAVMAILYACHDAAPDDSETIDFLLNVRNRIDAELGPFTLPQTMYVAHLIAGFIAFGVGLDSGRQEGFAKGFEAGAAKVVNLINAGRAPLAVKSGKAKPVAEA